MQISIIKMFARKCHIELRMSLCFNMHACLVGMYGFHTCFCSADKSAVKNTRHFAHSPYCNPSLQHSLQTLFPRNNAASPPCLIFKKQTK